MSAIRQLADAGVSVWLDDLGRDRLTSGDLARLVANGVCGVTTNPSIFAAAVSAGDSYADQLAGLAGVPAEEALHSLMVADVRAACDVLADTYDRTESVDGRVSLEVDPRLAFDTDATVAAATRIWADVDRANVMVKIPATKAGLPAITSALAAGVSVNVTLIFGVGRYQEVQDAWLAGLEAAHANGHDLRVIGSVASFFVSRLDSAVDTRLDALSADQPETEYSRLRGRAAVANARQAYRQFQQILSHQRWQTLAAAGAQPQRPLWASTSTKDPTFSPTRYVDELVAAHTVNTMPAGTLDAVSRSPKIPRDAIPLTDQAASHDAQLFADLEAVGIEYQQVVDHLEEAGVQSFIDAWTKLLGLVAEAQVAGV